MPDCAFPNILCINHGLTLPHIVILNSRCWLDKRIFNIKFWQFIASKRIEKGLTKNDLAVMIGNNAQNISRLERVEVSPTLFWITGLAQAFELSLSQLIKEFESFK